MCLGFTNSVDVGTHQQLIWGQVKSDVGYNDSDFLIGTNTDRETDDVSGKPSLGDFMLSGLVPADEDYVLVSSKHHGREKGSGASAAQAIGPGRILDVVGALLLLALLAPAMVLIGILVFVTDPGPILFSQRRVGRAGKIFDCYKFRSMYVGAEQRLENLLAENEQLRSDWELRQKLPNDPRVSVIGRLLRFTSLDELPQLFNVLRGEMSLVGPRPVVPLELQRYGRFATNYCSVRPGLTGLWQVTGRNLTTYRRRVAADVLYARSKSITLDCKILIATIPVVISGRGAS